MKDSMISVLRAAYTRRTAGELVWALLGLPLGIAGFVYTMVTLFVSLGLSVVLIGVPLLALSVLGARYLGWAQREFARALLGLEVPAPAPFRTGRGVVGTLRLAVTDAAGWRAYLYLLLKLPLGIASFTAAALLWGYGIAGTTYPFWRPFVPEQFDSSGRARRGAALGDDLWGDNWSTVLLIFLTGVALLLVAPWVVRALVYVDRLLIAGLLGPSELTERVRSLEHRRAAAVDDSAETLRRIERDLHDGAQARLVTLAMTLGQAQEELSGDAAGADLDRTRALVDAAHRDAKTALVELRDLARGIHPPVLDSGLGPALESLAARSAVPVSLHVDLPSRPSPAIETIAYYCAAELITNAVKHSGAPYVGVTLTRRGDRLRLQVDDDGRGGARIVPGGGLAGLVERTHNVDGRLAVLSPEGGPTVITAELPHQL